MALRDLILPPRTKILPIAIILRNLIIDFEGEVSGATFLHVHTPQEEEEDCGGRDNPANGKGEGRRVSGVPAASLAWPGIVWGVWGKRAFGWFISRLGDFDTFSENLVAEDADLVELEELVNFLHTKAHTVVLQLRIFTSICGLKQFTVSE
ncbi:hypothetical protein B0H19DRAFT_1085604 [Mycena capillaripes]|nr:hypothetical protein B0H19DRAFT_1085604 [Mycena capillaripes]